MKDTTKFKVKLNAKIAEAVNVFYQDIEIKEARASDDVIRENKNLRKQMKEQQTANKAKHDRTVEIFQDKIIDLERTIAVIRRLNESKK